ncbi:ABC-type transporter Mla maintaining outer membrane lipid asymmetry, periplasmic component MlaD [Mycobacterium numidiamassiliense]|uniref:ABC-type transporter Mla maintaining outer membrane lipid asymmetry, periplasmic component MlaD n=2 Tax=Mycobacterium numidiamassiliense TaxID=1841861 RepID=A0A2U3P957_9MYCO|nr:ABC-type transporter Mla maintaining outer membrane lipid asymmetry, periplasmic component MlaD [Mycobacterium numidiamassiliense]
MQSAMKQVHSPMFWGVTTLVMTTVIGMVVAWLYVSPPGKQIVTFYTDDAVSISPGDTVRIAGIVVGEVKDLAIEPKQVRVRATVDRDAFVGDQSQIEVRMLTVVGGYYVTINSLGDVPLGSRAVPLSRVTMPYSLIRTLADTTKITDNVATKPINESINQVQQGLTGANSDVITELLNAGNAITQNLERQRGQISSVLEFSNEYIRELNNNRELLEYMISRVAILEESFVLYGEGFAAAIRGMGDLGKQVLDPLDRFYMPHRSDFLARVRGVLGEFQAIADRNGVVVRVLRRIRERMESTLAAQNGGTPPELFATDLCIPVEGSRC